VEAVEWRLSYVLLPFFAGHRLSEITAREIDRYREEQLPERDRLRELPEAGRAIERRPLANSTITGQSRCWRRFLMWLWRTS
jgi:hypothetical protein